MAAAEAAAMAAAEAAAPASSGGAQNGALITLPIDGYVKLRGLKGNDCMLIAC